MFFPQVVHLLPVRCKSGNSVIPGEVGSLQTVKGILVISRNLGGILVIFPFFNCKFKQGFRKGFLCAWGVRDWLRVEQRRNGMITFSENSFTTPILGELWCHWNENNAENVSPWGVLRHHMKVAGRKGILMGKNLKFYAARNAEWDEVLSCNESNNNSNSNTANRTIGLVPLFRSAIQKDETVKQSGKYWNPNKQQEAFSVWEYLRFLGPEEMISQSSLSHMRRWRFNPVAPSSSRHEQWSATVASSSPSE